MGAKTRRGRWTQAEALRVLALWRSSGLPLAAFAEGRGERYERLRRWERKLSGSVAARFAVVEVPAAAGVRVDREVRIELTCGIRLVVSEGSDPSRVAALAQALGSAPC